MSAQILEVRVETENVNDVTSRILDWKVPNGAAVKEGQLLAELENSKTSYEVKAPGVGVVSYTWAVGDEVPVGEILCRISPPGATPATTPQAAAPKPATTPAPATATAATSVADKAKTVFSAKAELLMKELGLASSDFAHLAMVKEADVRAVAAAKKGAPAPPPSPAPAPVPAVKIESPSTPAVAPVPKAPTQPHLEGERVPLERAKLLENRELLAASRAILRSSIHFLSPADGLNDLCGKANPPIQRSVVVLFELIKLLQKYRRLNAAFEDDAAILYRHVNIGFAVDMGYGLKVLVIREAEKLSFTELSARYEDLLVKYTTNTLAVADLSGSTFTVTDLAAEGVFSFEPLINTQQAAILGIGSETSAGGGLVLSCAFDHRVTSGKEVAEFLRNLSNRVVAHRDSLKSAAAAQNPLACSRCLRGVDELRAAREFLVPSVEPAGYLCSLCLGGL